MGRFWERLRNALTARRGPLPVRDRFSLFQAICVENDRFLSRLAQLLELQAGAGPVPKNLVGDGRDALCDAVRSMVSALVTLAPGLHDPLLDRYATLEHELGARASGARLTMPLVVWPDSGEAQRPDLVGGKAANLAVLLVQGRYAIPPFFVLTAEAHRHFLEVTELQGRVSDLLDGSDGSFPDLRSRCTEIRRLILDAAVPASFAEILLGAFRQLGAPHAADFTVAVRSSATVEDSELSFAGQFETVLGVAEEGLVDAYKRVVASKYRYESVRYARMGGYLDEEVAMPVLFMSMVRPVSSGVAYSHDPEGEDVAVVSVVRGLAETASARVIPERFVVDRGLLRAAPAAGQPALHSTPGPTLDVHAVARMALALEDHFGAPQDVEWALDERGTLCLVQSRPLRLCEAERGQPQAVEGHRVLISRAQRACGGTACGRVVRLLDLEDLDAVADGSILVVPTTSPRIAPVVGRVAAILAETGSSTGHMATVAREFHVPTLVGAEGATAVLRDGMLVTVDAWSGRVYEGEVALERPWTSAPGDPRPDAGRQSLKRLLDRVSPLLLADPSSPDFTPERCQTLHDVARFVHQKSMAEMFAINEISARDRREARRLRWSIPMEALVLDLGGGLADDAGRVVEQKDLTSVPFVALVEGMTDPRLRWSGPVGFDLKGFMSVVVRSAADDQRYGEPTYAICSREFVHFSSRLAYHFATVDAMCTPAVNQNYARFVFFGGAAVAERREWRAHFLALVLKHNNFEVSRVRDRVEAVLGKRSAAAVEESLVLLGRLMAATRHLDMVMDSQATAESFAASFLSGDFGFELVRQGKR